jgi:hypothetical protein
MQRAWRTLLIAVLLAGFLGPDGCEGMEAPIRTGKTHLTLWFVYNALVTGREQRCRVG